MRKLVVMVVWLLVCAVPSAAQEDTCPVVVQAAMNATLPACHNIGRDQVCFGHAPVEAVPRAEARLTLAAPGDTVNATDVQTLRLGAMNLDSQTWGMALARISANLPEDGVTLLAFGDTELDNAGLEVPLVTLPARVKWRTGANIRALPAAEAELVASGNLGVPLLVIGRTADAAWLWVQMSDERLGWVAAELLQIEGNTDALVVVDPEQQAAPNAIYGPLQAFTFRSGIHDKPCPTAPPSGILIQTPAVDRLILLWANGVLLMFDQAATVFLQAQPDELAVQALEGTVEVYAANQLRTVEAGYKVRVPLDNFTVGTTVPRLPEPYVYADMRVLPLSVLPREVVVPVSLGGVIIPGQPSVDPLTAVDPEDACTVAAFTEARLRSGPGTNYPIVARIQAGDSARPDGRIGGTDGVLWWRLSPDFWVRADAVYMAGACHTLPIVTAPPVPVQP